MPGLSAYVENALLNTFRNTSYTVTTLYVSLHTADPSGTGASEVVGGSYARMAVTFGVPVSGVMANTGAVTLNVPGSTTVTHFGYWDSPNTGATPISGNFIGGAPLAATQVFGLPNVLFFAIGQLTFALTA